MASGNRTMRMVFTDAAIIYTVPEYLHSDYVDVVVDVFALYTIFNACRIYLHLPSTSLFKLIIMT